MKQFALLISVAVLSTTSFAGSSFNKNSPQLKALGSAWKSQQSVQINKDNDEMTMGYGGQDIANRLMSAQQIAAA